ncbi:flagellin FliC [Marinobacter sp. NP-4(2019)]|uniref:flagellin domain-containing protein n=1 Tax=Marinobacter sp. NP-4(2019) TaxID=2488665 RepID=UPI000FC3D535|nr:flagellin domain-containing protein [Marinobacter sp. NP-4(2019)]AZT84481.1 flagellin FliC [Marinobacter sp. NP-4(2019)]
MALGINTNVASLNAQNQLGKSQSLSDQALQRLSSGLRINSAKDDAAGIAIATRFDAQIRGLTVAQRNANDGISMTQTAEGALNETVANLQRMRELAVQASNGSNSADDRAALNEEFVARRDEITRIAQDTTFNGLQILDGTETTAIGIQVGSEAGQRIDIDFTSPMTAGSAGLAISGNSITAVTAASSAILALDNALDTVNTARSDLGAVQNRFESTINNLGTSIENLSASQSRILDADFAAETAKLAKANVLQQAGISVLAQANARPNQVLSLLQ